MVSSHAFTTPYLVRYNSPSLETYFGFEWTPPLSARQQNVISETTVDGQVLGELLL